MTDITKFKNVSLDIKTYELLKSQSKLICDVDLSLSQTVKHNANVTQSIMDSADWVKPLRGSKTYQKWKGKLLAKYMPTMRKETKHANSN